MFYSTQQRRPADQVEGSYLPPMDVQTERGVQATVPAPTSSGTTTTLAKPIDFSPPPAVNQPVSGSTTAPGTTAPATTQSPAPQVAPATTQSTAPATAAVAPNPGLQPTQTAPTAAPTAAAPQTGTAVTAADLQRPGGQIDGYILGGRRYANQAEALWDSMGGNTPGNTGSYEDFKRVWGYDAAGNPTSSGFDRAAYDAVAARGPAAGGATAPATAPIPAPTSTPTPAPIPFGPPSGIPASIPASIPGAPGSAGSSAPASSTPGGSAPVSSPLASGTSTAPVDTNAPFQTINPQESQSVQQLLARIQSEVLRGMDQPTMWDDELAQRVKDQAKRGIDENFDSESRALDARMAGRGIGYSSIAGDGMRDLSARRAGALSDVDTNIMRERANAIAQGRSSALQSALGALGMRTGLESQFRDEARGERSWSEGLRRDARDSALQQTQLAEAMRRGNLQDYLQLVTQGLNYGQGGLGASLLGSGASGLNNAANTYTGQAGAQNQQLMDLAQLATMFFGGGR